MAKTPSQILKDQAKALSLVKPEKFDFLKDEIPRIIQVRTRLGKGVSNGSISKLKPLSENYIKFRKGEMSFLTNKKTKKPFPIFNTMIKVKMLNSKGKEVNRKVNVADRFAAPELSNYTTPTKSNLTLSGEMLDSIVGTRIGTKFIFFFSSLAADLKAFWVKENGRPFFELSNSEKNGLQRRVARIIRDEIRSLFKS